MLNKFFINNRIALARVLPGAIVVVPAHSSVQKSADEAFAFRQDSNFWYLTGVNEPDLLLVIDTVKARSTILLPARNDYQVEWDGAVDTGELALISGVETIAYQDELKQLIKDAKKRKLSIYCPVLFEDRVEPYGFFANPARRNLEKLLLESGVKKVSYRMSASIWRN